MEMAACVAAAAARRGRVATIAVATALAASAAHSQDATWTGPYGGLSLGVARTDAEAERGFVEGSVLTTDVENGLFPDEIDGGEASVVGGLSAGYNVQRPGSTVVGGAEIDLMLLDQDARLDFAAIDPEIFVGAETASTYATEIDALATLRLRGGYALGNTLIYATGGVAAGKVENDLGIEISAVGYTSPDLREDDVLWGYVLGAGVERRISSRLSLKAEALWYDLEDVTIEATDPEAFPGNRLDYEFANDGVIARLGVNLAF